VLVTGGSGLVGSHVIEALRSKGERVRALVRLPSRAAVERLGAEAVVGDVTDPAAWRRAARGVRGIVHAAALVQQRATWEDHVAVNVGGTRLAAAAAHAEGAPLVHISSVSVYGGSAAYRPERERRTEEYPFRRIPESDFYARTKRMAEEVVRDSAEDGSFSAVALRPNVIYGERDRLFTPRVIRAVRRGFVPRIGPGTNHLSCVYAGHVATAAAAALDTPVAGFRAYNVTHDAPPALTLREFLEAFADALGSRLRSIPIPAGLARIVMGLWTAPRLARAAVAFVSGENPYVDDRARTELGWQPRLGTAEAVCLTARWFLENETPGR
jgi:nucleoside-diphosphate-sugar epimerase